MDQQHVTRLSSCLEIAELLSDPRKVVEDDTCLERILTAIEIILRESSGIYNISELLKSLGKIWETVKVNIRNYCCSSICYFLKFNSVLLVHGNDSTTKWKSHLDLLVMFPELDTEVKPNVFQHGKWFTPSVGSSWLFTIKSLISVSEIFSHISSSMNLYHIVLLCEAPSIFVQKEASDCMAEIGIVLLKVDKSDMPQLYDEFTNLLLKKLSLKKVIPIITKMLSIDHGSSMRFLSEITFSEYFILHKPQFLECCNQGEMFLSNFYEALFSSECREPQVLSMLEYVFHVEDALTFSILALTGNPTKHVVWKMLTSLLSYHPALKDSHFEIGISLLMLPLNAFFSEGNSKCTRNEDYTKWTEIVKNAQCHKTKMTSILSNCLSSTSMLWKFCRKFDDRSLSEKIVQILCWIGSNNQTLNRPFGIHENWKVATASLNVVLQCSSKFSQSELDSIGEAILTIMENPNINHTIYSICQKVASCIIEITPDEYIFVERCVKSAARKLLDRRWEMRDSALDHLSSLILNGSSNDSSISQIFARSNIHGEALRLADDENGFVRANALMLMKNLFDETNLYDMTSDNILDSILNIITKDMEAIPRRSAVCALLSFLIKERIIVKYLADAFSSKEDTNINVETMEDSKYRRTANAVYVLYEDLDWEVKYNAIDILEHLASYRNDTNIVENKTFNKSDELAFESYFKRMFDDCDTAVRDKAKSVHYSLFIKPSEHSSDMQSSNDSQIFHDMDNLLDEVLVSLRKDEQTRLSHGCHGPPMNGDITTDLEYDDSVIVDCY